MGPIKATGEAPQFQLKLNSPQVTVRPVATARSQELKKVANGPTALVFRGLVALAGGNNV